MKKFAGYINLKNLNGVLYPSSIQNIMMKEYINDLSNENSLIPSNLGLSDLTIEKSVEIYNRLALQRTEELKTATVDNPEVQNLSNRILKVKESIIKGINNLIQSKEKVLKKYRDENKHIRQVLDRNGISDDYILL